MTEKASGRWDDLITRVGTGLALAVVGLSAMWVGGTWYLGLIAVICGIILWELARMLEAGVRAVPIGIAGGILVFGSTYLLPAFAIPLLIAPGFLAYNLVQRDRLVFAFYTPVILLAGYGLFTLRDDFGFFWMSWLALLVIATDVMGYFAGRILGGPKFWPKVSPKKTWSGTIAGWVGAAVVGAIYMKFGGTSVGLIGASVALSLASQMGDIAESAIKRRAGIKDSSNILPGHGGLFDRFDGMLGAAVMLVIILGLIDLPVVTP